MSNHKIFSVRKMVCICAAVIFVFAMASVAYADDVGGIRRTMQLWILGDQTDAVWEVQDGHYSASYTDSDGNIHEIFGGGVAFDENGNERPATEEELLEHFMSPHVIYSDDGKATLYFKNQTLDITDKFDVDGICYILLDDAGTPLYVTVKYQNGTASSPHAYVQPWEFN